MIDHIFWCARSGETEEFIELVTADPLLISSLDENKNNLLHYISANGHLEIFKHIIEKYDISKLVNSVNSSGNTPLHWAVLNQKFEMIKLLIQSGADIEYQNSNGETPIDLLKYIENSQSLISSMEQQGCTIENNKDFTN